MAFLRKEQIHQAGLKTEVVEIPEWPDADGKPGELHVAEPTAVLRQRIDLYYGLLGLGKVQELKQEFGSLYLEVALACVKTPDGAPYFIEDDRAWLQHASGTALQRIFDAAFAQAKLTDRKEAVEGAKQGFTPAPSASSSSASPSA